MEAPLAGLSQVGVAGIVLAAVLGIVLRLFQRLIERLMAHLDSTATVLREIRDEMRELRAERNRS